MDSNEEVACILQQWGLGNYAKIFEENSITTMTLASLEPNEIKELIPSIGHRVTFTKNLGEWRNTGFPSTSASNIGEVQELPCSTMTEGMNFTISDLINATIISESNSSETPLPLTDLKELLESSLDGKSLLSIRDGKPLENTPRLRLVRLISTCILKNCPERNITASIYEKWANEIVDVFPQEKKSVYFHTKLVDSGRFILNRLAGKLPDQIHNLKRKYREAGIIAKRSRVSSKSPSPQASPTSRLHRFPVVINDNGSAEAEQSVLWLKTSSHPWATVEEKWGETTVLRVLQSGDLSIDEYFKEYPALNKPLGHLLLKKDFDFLYPSNGSALVENFPALKKQIFDIAAKRTSSKDLFLKYLLNLSNSSEEISNLGTFLLIPTLLSVSTLRLKGTKKVWRPSKAEVREGFITHVSSDAEIGETIINRKEKFMELGLTLQPFIIIVGPSLEDIRSFIIVVNDTKYVVSNILEAIDTCFKTIFVVNAQYPVECHCTWIFIQTAFYRISTKFDKVSTAANTLLGELGIHD